jgi:hypothetical protein
LAVGVAFLVAVIAAHGIFLGRIHAWRTRPYATVGGGVDWSDLLIFAPIIAIAAYFAFRGSLRARLILIGMLLYTAYGYFVVTYHSFIRHIWSSFPVGQHVIPNALVFALSAIAFTLGLRDTDPELVKKAYAKGASVKAVSIFLAVFGILSAAVWFLGVFVTRHDAVGIGIMHVVLLRGADWLLHVAYFVSLVATARMLALRKPAGFVFTPVLFVFAIEQWIEIGGEELSKIIRHLDNDLGFVFFVAAVMLTLIGFLIRFLRGLTDSLSTPEAGQVADDLQA